MNAYEIRLEVLKMAKEMLQQEQDTKIAVAFDIANKNGAPLISPVSYTSADVVSKADELIKFINN